MANRRRMPDVTRTDTGPIRLSDTPSVARKALSRRHAGFAQPSPYLHLPREHLAPGRPCPPPAPPIDLTRPAFRLFRPGQRRNRRQYRRQERCASLHASTFRADQRIATHHKIPFPPFALRTHYEPSRPAAVSLPYELYRIRTRQYRDTNDVAFIRVAFINPHSLNCSVSDKRTVRGSVAATFGILAVRRLKRCASLPV